MAQPHAFTLSTAGPTGHVTARTLILKDLVDGQWVFAGARSTRKGIDLAARRGKPEAELTPEERAQAKGATDLTKRARQMARLGRRIGRF